MLPEPQQAPQYLIDLMAPLVARITTIEELVANHIAPPPSVAETAISQGNGTPKFQKNKEGHPGDKECLLPPATRFLQSSAQFLDSNQSVNLSTDSDVAVVLASLLCAVICILGLALVARCACLRQPASSPRPTNRGIKTKVLNSLPTVSFDVGSAGDLKLADCAICLAEFEEGELVRVLPPCGHGFHLKCIDTCVLRLLEEKEERALRKVLKGL
ncbi:probable E3 ubiquitin-protein ligase ATL44 [Asparagus officinalis]|uniref:probable E3 ubiquitin-protein ligase ATL44 n=1 Tax=Asparagus officinalis TaxID=4686 RepID=UPI00098E6A99|nr:probable E3 ubiquitin-protein ligase ATL44 [Asparagus officinalis]